MRRVTAVPFARPDPASIAADPWLLHGETAVEELPDSLPDWDYHTHLVLTRTVGVDSAAVRGHCGLHPGAPLRLAAFWEAQGTALRGTIDIVDVPDPGEVHVLELSGRLQGGTLCGSVNVETKLIVAKNQDPSLLRPYRAGSVLWSDQASVRLEGVGSRFPVAIVDFSELLGHPDEAGWLLSWNPLDLHQPFMGTVQLLLNKRHLRVVEAVSAASSAGGSAIRSAVYYDVARSLIRGALDNDEFVGDADSFVQGSVGDAVKSLLGRLFPGESIRGIRNGMREQPDYFDSLLQAKLRLFAD